MYVYYKHNHYGKWNEMQRCKNTNLLANEHNRRQKSVLRAEHLFADVPEHFIEKFKFKWRKQPDNYTIVAQL